MSLDHFNFWCGDFTLKEGGSGGVEVREAELLTGHWFNSPVQQQKRWVENPNLQLSALNPHPSNAESSFLHWGLIKYTFCLYI